jgi:deazaflavin-dependent oxidoreductase (nitroreductase family)
MGLSERALIGLSKTSGLRWVLSKTITPLDMKLKGSRFAPSRFLLDVPLCYLTTTGRNSGEPRTVPLLFVDAPSGGRAVAATNFGRRSHPGWAYNLEAEPSATLETEGESTHVHARSVNNEEVLEIWPLFDGIWPGYESYRGIAPRSIKVFVLTAQNTEDGSQS